MSKAPSKDEKDIVVMTTDNGETIELEVYDYFLYDGLEYVILSNFGDNSYNHEEEVLDIFIMKVNIIDNETEEFIPIPPEEEDAVIDFAERYLKGESSMEDEIY